MGFQYDLVIIQKWLTFYWATLYSNQMWWARQGRSSQHWDIFEQTDNW